MADIKQITKYLAGLLSPKKKNTNPTDPWYASDNGMGTPPFNPNRDTQVGEYTDVPEGGYNFPAEPPLKIIGLNTPSSSLSQPVSGRQSIYDTPEVQNFMKGITDAQSVLNQPAPKLQSAKINPWEGLAAAFIASKNPFAAGKTLEVPGQLAAQRAETANQDIINQFQQTQRGAQSTINTNTKLIDYALDRDAVAQRVEAQLKAKQMDIAVKKEIATLNNNTQLIKTLANLAGNGGITEPAVAAIYMNLGYEPDEAHTIASGVVDSIIKNPSMQMKIKQAQLENDQQKIGDAKIKDDWNNLQNPNSTPLERYQIIRRLQKAGEIEPDVSAWDFAQAVGAQTKNLEEGLKLKQAQEDKLKAETAYKDELRKYLPTNQASQIAQRYANIDHLRNLDQQARDNFDLRQQQFIHQAKKQEYDAILGGLSKEYGSLQTDINSLRASRKGLETALHKIQTQNVNGKIVPINDADTERYEFLVDEIGRYDRTIQANKAKQEDIHNKAESTRTEMRGDDIDITQSHQPRETPIENNRPISNSTMGKINNLKEVFTQSFPGGRFEQYAPKGGRNIQGTNTPSLHNQGLALDLYPGKDQNLQDVADWAISQPGVKTVIYNRQVWNPTQGWHPYSEKGDPHTTHVHVDYGRSGNTGSKNNNPPSSSNKKKITPNKDNTKLPSGWSFSGG
jgi:hypothetical protein